MTDGARKFAGWLWVGAFYILVFVAGIALVGGGTDLATFGWGIPQNYAWHLVAGIAVFAGGAILLFRMTSIPVPGRHPDTLNDTTNARLGEYGYTDSGTYVGHGYHHGGGHDGVGGGGN